MKHKAVLLPKIGLPWTVKFTVVHNQVIPPVPPDSITDVLPEDAEQALKNFPIPQDEELPTYEGPAHQPYGCLG